MYLYLVKIFLLCLFITTTSLADTIKKIEVTGNKRISKETILVLSDIKIASDLNDLALNNSLKKLYETDFFSDINFIFNDGNLKINVKENPIIEKININGIKKKSFLENLYSSISLKDRTSFTDFKLKNDITLLNNILKTNGYYFSSINITSENNESLNSILLNINIDLGEKAKIKEIIFIGDKKFKDKKLLELIASEEHKFWKFISNKVYLNESLIDLDKRLLGNFYKNNGYYNVQVLNSFAELNKDGDFKLIFNVNAGDKYFFDKFNLILPQDYEKADFEEVLDTFDDLSGEI